MQQFLRRRQIAKLHGSKRTKLIRPGRRFSAVRSTEIGAEAGRELSVEEMAKISYNDATSDNA
jgi:hypothetical protein